ACATGLTAVFLPNPINALLEQPFYPQQRRVINAAEALFQPGLHFPHIGTGIFRALYPNPADVGVFQRFNGLFSPVIADGAQHRPAGILDRIRHHLAGPKKSDIDAAQKTLLVLVGYFKSALGKDATTTAPKARLCRCTWICHPGFYTMAPSIMRS